jgi:hypothetical protein
MCIKEDFSVIFFCFMVFNATFNNISVISWWSVLLVEEIGVPVENHRPVASHWQILSHNVVSSTPRLNGFELATVVVIGTDYIGSWKSYYHAIMTTTDPSENERTILLIIYVKPLLNVITIRKMIFYVLF